MHFDFETMSHQDCYRLLVNSVVPRPIAFVTSVDHDGTLNAAPFSFFNVMGHDPPVVVVGIERKAGGAAGALKDTAANIRSTHEFVINLVSEEMVEAMSTCAADFSADVDELDKAGLAPLASTKVAPLRIALSPASFECREMMSIGIGDGRTLVVGTVVAMHLQDRFYDESTRRISTPEMRLVGRMHGKGWYARTSDLFFVPRGTVSDATGEPSSDPSPNEPI
ncbi:MAG: flavin reductase family protein [Trueperaceae bacterium]